LYGGTGNIKNINPLQKERNTPEDIKKKVGIGFIIKNKPSI
jgi:hypothetical protein